MLNVAYSEVSSTKMIENISVPVGVIVLTLCLAFCWKQWKMMRTLRHLPSRRLDFEWMLPLILGKYPKDIPFTSLIFQIMRKTVKEFREEGLCVLWFLQPYIFVFSEKYTKDLVNEVYLDRSSFLDLHAMLFGNGLLSSHHDTWKVHRKLLNPMFSVGVLKCRMSHFNKSARQLVDKLDMLVDKPGDDIADLLKYCSFQNVTDFVFGLKLDNKKHISLSETFMEVVNSAEDMIMKRGIRPWLHWNFMLPFFPMGRKYLKTMDDINCVINKITSELETKNTESNREQTDDDSEEASSAWAVLKKLYVKDHVFTEKDVRDHIVTFTAAGYDTVHVTMLWCCYTLGHHPQVQEKVYRELQTVVPNGDITYEDLGKLKYLECVIKETMRLYSSVPVYMRKAAEDIQCGQYTIPKGTELSVLAFELHRDPNVFPEPEKFDPERFTDSSKLRSWMYLPFFEGYRNCIGKKFAVMEIKVTLAQVLRRFRITSLNKINDNEFLWTITLNPSKPLRFLFENRQSK